MLKIGSLFSGAGLCDLGLDWAGFRHQWFSEIDTHCRAVLSRHWPDVPVYGDIATLHGADLPHIDILCGGFPCQDVSKHMLAPSFIEWMMGVPQGWTLPTGTSLAPQSAE